MININADEYRCLSNKNPVNTKSTGPVTIINHRYIAYLAGDERSRGQSFEITSIIEYAEIFMYDNTENYSTVGGSLYA